MTFARHFFLAVSVFFVMQYGSFAESTHDAAIPKPSTSQDDDLLQWRPVLHIDKTERLAENILLSSRGKIHDILISTINKEEVEDGTTFLGCCAAALQALMTNDEKRYKKLGLLAEERASSGTPQEEPKQQERWSGYGFLVSFLFRANNSDARVLAQYHLGGLDVADIRVCGNKLTHGNETTLCLPLQEYSPGHYRLAEEFVRDPLFQFLNSRLYSSTAEKSTKEEFASLTAGSQILTFSGLWGDETGRYPVKLSLPGVKIPSDRIKVEDSCRSLRDSLEQLRPELHTGKFPKDSLNWQRMLGLFDVSCQAQLTKYAEGPPTILLLELPASPTALIYTIQDANLFIAIFKDSEGVYQCAYLVKEGDTLCFANFGQWDHVKHLLADPRVSKEMQALVSNVNKDKDASVTSCGK